MCVWMCAGVYIYIYIYIYVCKKKIIKTFSNFLEGFSHFLFLGESVCVCLYLFTTNNKNSSKNKFLFQIFGGRGL